MFRRRTMLSGTAGTVSSLLSGRAWSHGKETSVSASAEAKSTFTLVAGQMKWLHFSYVPNPALGTPDATIPGMITPHNAVWVRQHYANSPLSAGNEWSLEVNGTTTLTLTLGQLKVQFRAIEVDTFCQLESVPKGSALQFKCRLKGVWLKDVLAAAGVPDSVRGSTSEQGRVEAASGIESVFWLDMVNDESPILAYEINGASLWSYPTSPVHLFMPIVPGLYVM